MKIDVDFDFRLDTLPGKDPDVYSPMLREYHRRLWSKCLPNGSKFDLSDSTPSVYLHHKSDLGEFWLSSDGAIPTFTRKGKCSAIVEQIPTEEIKLFNRDCYTIGGIIFPANRIERKNTINGSRGFHPRIQDRFDLTVECIRRHYVGNESPLSVVLQRYDDFFSLFQSFDGYVKHFLLEDIVSEDYSAVRFFLPFDGFERTPLPTSVPEYEDYKRLALAFVHARGSRIANFSKYQ